MSKHIELNRKFLTVKPDKENDPETIRMMLNWGTDIRTSWEDLLQKPRIVILGEPGTGKTDELRAVSERLGNVGKIAWF